MTQLDCPLQQPRCGLQEGNPICPKCGLDVRVPYVSQEAGEAARKTALAAWAIADQAESAQPEPPSPQPNPEPVLPSPPRGGAMLLVSSMLVALLAGGGYLYWHQQKELQAALAQQQQIQQTQEREKEQARQIAMAHEQQIRQAREQAQAAEQSKLATQAALEKQLALHELKQREKEQALALLKAELPPIPRTKRDPASPPEMVVVPGGSFQMGSNDIDSVNDEKPVHSVNVKTFAIGKYEVTQGQWRAVMGSNPSEFARCGDNCPVEHVSWADVQSYIQKLNQKTGQQFRLPSEAEWEYACRGGQPQMYCGSNDLAKVAWYGYNSASTTHPVGQKAPNEYGLHDMSGNVWEWVEDWYHDNQIGAPSDGSARVTGGEQKYRVLRGGSWLDSVTLDRAAYRYFNSPDHGSKRIGFRLARTVP